MLGVPPKSPNSPPTIFVSHASEDKDEFARPLSEALQAKGLGVWFDEFVLNVGDSLRESIDEGLSICDFGVVILSEAFFSKRWTKQELNALIARETTGSRNLILPIWHKVDRHHVAEFSVFLADRMALRSSDGVKEVAEKIYLTIKRSRSPRKRAAMPAPLLPAQMRPQSRSASNPGSETRIEWHPVVHERWGDTRLLWVRLRYTSSYVQPAVADGLLKALNGVGATAFSYDELAGAFDGLLKVWLPNEVDQRQLRDGLIRNLDQLGEFSIFSVDRIVRHWIWMRSDGRAFRMPDPKTLESDPPPPALEGHRAPRQVDQLLQQGLVAEVASPLNAIGFFVGVEGPSGSLLQQQLQSELERVLDVAVGILEPALYFGHGFATFAITGHVVPGDFDRLHAELIEPTNTVASFYESRTVTLLTTTTLFRSDEPRLQVKGKLPPHIQ